MERLKEQLRTAEKALNKLHGIAKRVIEYGKLLWNWHGNMVVDRL